MARILIDTDILIDHLRNLGYATDYIRKILPSKPTISIITRIELLSGNKINGTEEVIIKDLLRLFEIIQLDEALADIAAIFRRKYPIGLADSIIAASAFKEGAVLATRNLKHFKNISEIKVLSPYKI